MINNVWGIQRVGSSKRKQTIAYQTERDKLLLFISFEFCLINKHNIPILTLYQCLKI